ncbi:MAG: peptidylprolyl isomerase, partial [Planctomycetota bacterium]
VTDGDYTDSFIHRSVPGFVIQGGGFRWVDGDNGVSVVPTDPAVVNEPGLTNLRGTLAYAKQSGDPNSATSGWFLSLTDDNATSGASLDTQNGGFTVFGAVIGNRLSGGEIVNDGLDVVDDFAALTIVNAGGAFTTLPVLDTFESPTIFREDLAFVNSISILTLAAGDYDLNGVVDTEDLALWRRQVGSSLRIADHTGTTPATAPATTLDADGNGDGVVDGADYAVWRNSFAQANAAAAANFPVSVPEPATLAVVLTALAAGVSRRSRRGAR